MIDRTEFAKIIDEIVIPESSSAEELRSKTLPLHKVLWKIMPQKLFRYRKCSLRNIEAFNSDQVFSVTTDQFNDPYDGLVMYDIQRIKQFMSIMTTPEVFTQYQEMVKTGAVVPANAEHYLKYIPNDFIENIKSNILSLGHDNQYDLRLKLLYDNFIAHVNEVFPMLAKLNKRCTTIACFSETINSVTMWSHYADYHKGFALEYNVREAMGIENSNIMFMPVIYGDKRFDATDFILWEYLKSLNINIPNPDIMMHAKCMIHKSKQWEYEQEWRMIATSGENLTDTTRNTRVRLVPSAIYYGQDILIEDKTFLHDIAQKKGIDEYEMYLDYSSTKYEMLYRRMETNR